MSIRKKALRFEEIKLSKNVLEESKELYGTIKGRWNEVFFNNSHPIVLEIGCGKGEYTVGLAEEFPNKNFIGIDIKGDRIAVGSKRAQEKGLINVGFLRAKIQSIEMFFDENEVDEIWITFPDPHVLASGIRRRLTNERFLSYYQFILKQEGTLHLKTDSESFFDYSLQSIIRFGGNELEHTRDLYQSPLNILHHGIKTRFETIFTNKGFLINYLHCKLPKLIVVEEVLNVI